MPRHQRRVNMVPVFLLLLSCSPSLALIPAAPQLTSNDHQPCRSTQVAVYRLVLDALWTNETFPKQYPEFRPPAQWSRIVGRTHNSSFNLFSEGSVASESLHQFAERGVSEALSQHGQGGTEGVLDLFSSEALSKGYGRLETLLFVDGAHSLVSFVMRMIPSPDWFIGVDSLNLCDPEIGRWLETKTVQLNPLDAGSDSGFTFTSPNWRTDPPQPVSAITAHEPDHPAASFNYPELEHLPPIAMLTLDKVRVYEQSKSFTPPLPSTSPPLILTSEDLDNRNNNHLSTPAPSTMHTTADPPHHHPQIGRHHVANPVGKVMIDKMRVENENGPSVHRYGTHYYRKRLGPHHGSGGKRVVVHTNLGVHHSRSRPEMNTGHHHHESPSLQQWPGVQAVSVDMTNTNKRLRMEQLMRSYYLKSRNSRMEQAGLKRRRRVRHPTTTTTSERPQDDGGSMTRCGKVSSWSTWSPCSATCGVGEQIRKRSLLNSRSFTAVTCGTEILQEERWCSAHTACTSKYFRWRR